MSDPSSHDPLPSALSSLFEASHHHFLPAAGDDGDILIDPALQVSASQPSPVPGERMDVDSVTTQDAILEIPDTTPSKQLRPTKRQRRNDPSPIDVTLMSLAAENERLKKVISMLERPSVEATEDAIAEATLRELATAAVGVGVGVGAFGFESLQQHLEQHAQQVQQIQQAQASQSIRSSQGLDHISDPANDTDVSPSDFLHGLVVPVTAAPPSKSPCDPYLITRLALENELARIREAIAAKEVEIAASRSGTQLASTETAPEDRAAIEARLTKTTTLLGNGERNAAVLRDIAARLQENVDKLQSEVAEKKAELAQLDATDGSAVEGTRALLEVRSFIEGALKLWQKGELPPAPPPPVPLLVRPETLQPPPSSLPKKRGRPARSTQKASVVPAALAHLVPDSEAVRARELDAPIRRKGIKRGKEELEREKQREEAEGEMLRNLVGMGVWTKEGGYVDGEF